MKNLFSIRPMILVPLVPAAMGEVMANECCACNATTGMGSGCDVCNCGSVSGTGSGAINE